MSSAPAAAATALKGGGNKKLIIIIAAAVLVLVLGGVVALLLLKKKAASTDEEGGDTTHEAAPDHAAPKPGTPPMFVPLEPFTVNLADKDIDRFAQIGITLQVEDSHTADQIKTYLPAIRSNVLMVLSYKTSAELLTREGKEKLAADIMRESIRPMGIELDDEDEEPPADAAAAKKKKKKKAHVASPVTKVLFSTFIVQ